MSLVFRDYQLQVIDEGASRILKYKIAYLAMEMRTGKTLCALEIARRSMATKILFFTKKKAISSIEKDFKLLGADYIQFKALNYEKLTSFFEEPRRSAEDDEGRSAVQSVFNTKRFYADYFDPDFIILDEAHSLGQFPVRAQKVTALKKICVDKPILYLSGTPSPESYSQLFHQFFVSSFSPFAEYKSFYTWAKGTNTANREGSISNTREGQFSDKAELLGFVNIKHKYFFNRQINDYSDANKELIDQYTKHLFITMTQEKAGFEQVVTDKILTVKMQDSTYYLAKKLIKDRIFKGSDGSIVLADTEVKLMGKLHQIFSGTVKCEDEFIAHERKGDHVPISQKSISKCFDHTKAKFIKETFASQKIAIFYCFKEELNMLQWVFGFDNLTDSPEEFAVTNKTFVSQIVSGREGVNLSSADALVMLNISFSALSYIQGRQRMQSKERTKDSVVYWIFVDGGIEQKIYDRVVNKLDYTKEYFKNDYLK